MEPMYIHKFPLVFYPCLFVQMFLVYVSPRAIGPVIGQKTVMNILSGAVVFVHCV